MNAIACTLPASDMQVRLAQIQDLAQRHLLGVHHDGRQVQLRYAAAAQDEIREIVRLESRCCAFLSFALEERLGEVQLTITAPPEAGEMAATLFEHFAAGRDLTPSPAPGTSS